MDGKTFIQAKNMESWGKTGIIKFIMRKIGRVLGFSFGLKRGSEDVKELIKGILISNKKNLDRLGDVTEVEGKFLVSLKLT
jgi:hypothetical protein